jgi:hypothetical protein
MARSVRGSREKPCSNQWFPKQISGCGPWAILSEIFQNRFGNPHTYARTLYSTDSVGRRRRDFLGVPFPTRIKRGMFVAKYYNICYYKNEQKL